MPRILLVTTTYPEEESGRAAAGSFVQDFASELSLAGPVTVLAPGHAAITTGHDGMQTVRFAAPRLPLSLLNPLRPLDWWAIAATMQRGRQALDRVVTEAGDVGHILALWALPSGFWARGVSRRHGIPYSCWALGSDIWTLGRIPLVRSLLSQVIRDAAFRYADGYQLAADVERIGGRPCRYLPSVRRLPQGTRSGPASEPPYRLAYLGRWHMNKGVDLLLDALDELRPDDWSRIAEVRIAGGGPMELLVRERIAALRAAHRPVSALGYLEPPDAAQLLRWADYVLLPSRIESVPVVFSDALQCARPVVSMPVGDLTTLVANYGVGILSRAVSGIDYARALQEALSRAPTEFQSGISRALKTFDLPQAAASVRRELLPGRSDDSDDGTQT